MSDLDLSQAAINIVLVDLRRSLMDLTYADVNVSGKKAQQGSRRALVRVIWEIERRMSFTPPERKILDQEGRVSPLYCTHNGGWERHADDTTWCVQCQRWRDDIMREVAMESAACGCSCQCHEHERMSDWPGPCAGCCEPGMSCTHGQATAHLVKEELG